MSRLSVRCVALAVLPAALAVGVSAQDKDRTKKTSHERLQPYWNQLDLTEEQRVRYDRVVREYGPKIDELESQLEALKDRRRKEWQAILTAEQKRKLESLQAQRGKKKQDDDGDARPSKDVETTKSRKDTRSDDPAAGDKKTTTKKKTTRKDDG